MELLRLPVDGAYEIHSLDLVSLGALLDDHRQTAVHLECMAVECGVRG